MNKKRLFKILFLVLLIIAINVILILILGKKIYTNRVSEEQIIINYLEKSEKFKLLHLIADDVIVENKGINIEKIPKDKVEYDIINDDEDIIFWYVLKDNYKNQERYVAIITLSDDYSILESNYSVEKKENLRDFINSYTKCEKITSIFLVIFILICAYLVIFLISVLVYTLKLCFDSIKRTNK